LIQRRELVLLKEKTEDNYIFVEIKLNDNLYKLWHLNEKRFIVYDKINSKFTLSKDIIEYNDIDILDNIDYSGDKINEYAHFKFINTGGDGDVLKKKQYTLAYYNMGGPLYLHPSEPKNSEFYYNVKVLDGSYTGVYKNIDNIEKNLGINEEYCKICNSNNTLEDNLLDAKLYNVESERGDMFLSLGKYEMQITKIIEMTNMEDNNMENNNMENNNMENNNMENNNMENNNMENNNDSELTKYIYFEININKGDEYIVNLPVKKFKEKTNLKNMFKIINDNDNLKMSIVTVGKKSDKYGEGIKIYNIIIWENETTKEIIGRFEDKFDKPSVIVDVYHIIYDSSDIKLEKNENTSYVFTTYVKPPSGSYIQLNKLSMEQIKNFKLSLFHIDNSSIEQDEILSDTSKSIKANTRKTITTCAWGECSDFEKLKEDDAKKYLTDINQLEVLYGDYKQMGGKVDINMIQFIRNVSIDKDNDNYHNKINTIPNYTRRESSYYNKEYLLDILFKKNDIVEFYKIFGKNGWTNSYNSIYSKTLFTIDKPLNEINDLDYYDSFRNIYPVSWLDKKFALNVENMWKYNNWFEDNPHFRSLPNWKFELVQAIETSNVSDSKLQITLGGNIFNKMTLYNFVKNPIIMFIIIIIGIFIVFKFFKNY